MPQHPIEGLMDTAMKSIKEMVDVNTIIGDTVQTGDGTVIIPVSKVCFGFASGGGEYGNEAHGKNNEPNNGQEKNSNDNELPFAGGSAAGVSICPVAFMTVSNGEVKLLSVNTNASVDKLLDLIPDLFKRKDHKKNPCDEKTEYHKKDDLI